MRTQNIFLTIIILLAGLSQSYAGKETVDTYLKTDQITQGAVMKLKDNKIYGPAGYNSGWTGDFRIKETNNAVELFVNTSAKDFGRKNFDVNLDLKISYRDSQDKVVQNNQGKDTTRFSLSINYNPDKNFKNRDVFVFENAHKIHLEVENVTFNGADTASLTNVVMLRSFISTERYYDMTNSAVNTLSHQYISSDNELALSWEDKQGAIWYDVEWAFVDNYGEQNGNLQRKSERDISFNFRWNSQRIRTKDNFFTIPVVYEEGYLVYRVRPIAIGGQHFERKKYGPWSLDDKGTVYSAGSHAFTITSSLAHESDKMNWGYQATFTERATKKAATKYFDGLNYSRQQVEQLHSENDVLVSENLYDYHGRKAMEVLPSPTGRQNPTPALQYYDAFNQNTQGSPYGKKNFDNQTGCPPIADPMNNASGAARYYSSNNSSMNLFRDYLADAEGYPFSQTQYMADKSQNVRRQGKSGKQYQIGKGHAIQKFIGTPGQSELDRLFGSEAGYARHYQKKIIANENGQLTVQYIDEKGNKIASALAGDKPTALEKLPDDQVETRTIEENLLENRQNIRGNRIEASKKILVATEGSRYSFKYTLNPADFSRYVCEGETICYDGIYDLRIRMISDCGEVVKDTTMQIGDVNSIDETCDNNQPVTLSFSSGPLSVGSYFLSKSLVINEEAIQQYLDLFAQKSCIQAQWDVLYEENKKEMDTMACNVGCGSADAIQREYTYTTADGEEHTDVLTDEVFASMQEQRKNLCGNGANSCQSAYEAMLRDVSPSGQYALYYDTTKNEINPEIFSLSVLDTTGNELPIPQSHWRNPAGAYRDANGDSAYISLYEIEGWSGVKDVSKVKMIGNRRVTTPDNLLYLADFLDLWQDSWAEALVPYHPEYGYYLYCRQYPNSNNFDKNLIATGRFDHARDSGLVKTNGTINLLSNDPFFQANSQLKSEMSAQMNDFVNIQGQTFTLEEMVIAMHNGCAVIECAQGTVDLNKLVQCINNNKPLFQNKDLEQQTQEWTTYRSIYLALKKEIMNQERHQYAINQGYFNGCIGIKDSDDNAKIAEVLKFIVNYSISGSFSVSKSCFDCTSCYADKKLRFPDGDDIYKYVDGLEDTENPLAEAEQLENYVDNKLKANCNKCPVETDLETLLNSFVLDGNITGSQDATEGLASCDLKDQMNTGGNDIFSWNGSVSGNELIGNLKAGPVNVCTINLYDSSSRKIPWDSIRLFTCLEHITNTDHYQNTQKRNFKIRAISKNHEVYWLEGVTSCIDLTDCDIEKFCEKNDIADDLTGLFTKTFGIYPEMREMLVAKGYGGLADQKMPLYKNTNLISELVINISQRLKEEHNSPVRPGNYYWKVNSLSADKQSMSAGIYGPKKISKCLFDFEILDSTKTFGTPFIVDKMLLNHPVIDQYTCDATSFVLAVRSLDISTSQSTLSSVGGTANWTDAVSMGEVYYIKVTNSCYSVGECCPESNCPDIAENGGFEKGNNGFTSDLDFSNNEKLENYYTIYPKGSVSGDIPMLDIPQGDFRNINNQNFDFNPNLLNDNNTTSEDDEGETSNTNMITSGQLNLNTTDIPQFTGDSGFRMNQVQEKRYRMNKHFGVISEMMQSQHETQEGIINNMTSGDGDNEGNALFTRGQVDFLGNLTPQTNLLMEQNSYMVFKLTGNASRKVWKQNLNLDANNSYSISVKVRPVSEDTVVAQPSEAQMQFAVLLNGQSNSLEFIEQKGNWIALKGYLNPANGDNSMVSIQFTPSSDLQPVDYQKWAVDDIVIKPQNCPKPGCCPPISPKAPDDAFENPCKALKESIAETNTNIEFERFLSDTLTGIETALRKTVMNPGESFTMTYSDNFYKYTLFYFDQSDNLVKTVPPKGFNPLSDNKTAQVQTNRNQNQGSPVYPNHKETTSYEFNSYNEMVSQNSPDEGQTKYWYDELGRLVAYQTAAQKQSGNVYTYHLYDELSRKTESGQVTASGSLTSSLARDYKHFDKWVRSGNRTQVIHKYYDKPLSSKVDSYFPNGQQNLRKRVATIIYEEKWDNKRTSYDFATHFSYDAHGHVSFLVKENTKFISNHKVKKVDYEFDIVSGDISKITYQPGQKDQFIHKYYYDRDNRLYKVMTSKYGLHWEEEARYYYYPHGKIARIELGDEKVQGLDFAYTLQGWLKGTNGAELSPTTDAGKDGANSGPFSTVASDAVSMVLDYNSGDYKAIGGQNTFIAHLSGALGNSSEDLYNSDIRQMVINNVAFDNQGLAMAYDYDQLGRLVNASSYLANAGSWQANNKFDVSFSYDANGNLTDVTRQGNNGPMDQLSYHYRNGNNRLDHLKDQVGDGQYPNDIDNQNQGNYSYDAQGRLTQDLAEGLQNVRWARHDKVKSVVKKGYGSMYSYYDGTGFRVMKDYMPTDNADSKVVSYVRGVNNELLAKYTYDANEDSTYLTSQYIHGSSRLGTYTPDTTMDALQSKHVGFYRGQKQYEIGNHLDNVLVTVSDKKLPDTTSAGNHAYLPDIVSATDYYPFGAQIPGRKMNTGAYGHGFQGKEKDDVIKGEGNSYYFKERMYDPRVGRWLSVDPKAGKFPGRTPYNGMGNNPVNRIDPDGAEDESSEKKSFPERMDEKSATTFEPNLFGGQDKYEDALDLWNEGKKKEAVQTAMIADYERNIDVLTEEGKKTLKGYTKKQLMKQGEKAIKGMLAKDKVGIKLVEAYEKGKGFHEKVTGFIDKASSAKKIYEAWADMPDDIRGNRAEAARQFDKMFGAAGELMEDVPLAGNYSNFLTEFSEKGFFINFVNLNHLNTPESAMEYMPDTDEYRERQRKHREKWGR